jgi:RNA polymerase sigma factor (sigma-70 family)
MDESGPPTILIDLVRRSQEGDERALEQLLGALHVHAIRFLESWLHQSREWRELARDLAQDTLIRAARGLGAFRGTTDGEVVAWCVVIARNAGVDRLRAERDEKAAEDVRVEVDGFRAGNWGRDADGDEASTGLRVLVRLLGEVHDEEPEESQELLWRRLVQHDTWREAGQALGVPETAAKRRYQRAQERLRVAVLRKVVRLAPHELAAVSRWLERAGVAVAA